MHPHKPHPSIHLPHHTYCHSKQTSKRDTCLTSHIPYCFSINILSMPLSSHPCSIMTWFIYSISSIWYSNIFKHSLPHCVRAINFFAYSNEMASGWQYKQKEVNGLKNIIQPLWVRIIIALALILLNLLGLPIAIYLLFAMEPGTVISNWDITLSIGFLLACNILSVQLLIAKRNRLIPYLYTGLLLAFLQLISCCLYMNLYTMTAYLLFAATIILSLFLLVQTIRTKNPALM